MEKFEKQKLCDLIAGMDDEQRAEIVKCIPSVFLWNELMRREKDISEKLFKISEVFRLEGVQ